MRSPIRIATVCIVLAIVTCLTFISGCGNRNYGYSATWKTFVSKEAGISFSYPESWTLCTEGHPKDKYSTLYIAAFNSFNKDPFWVQQTQPRPNNWFYITEQDIAPIPTSGAYIEIGRLDPTKMILGYFPLVKDKGLKGATTIHEGPITIGQRTFDKYLIKFKIDDDHYFYIFAYLTDDAREEAKPVLDRFLKSVTVLE